MRKYNTWCDKCRKYVYHLLIDGDDGKGTITCPECEKALIIDGEKRARVEQSIYKAFKEQNQEN